jgi:Tfp pilus assembly protein FimT
MLRASEVGLSLIEAMIVATLIGLAAAITATSVAAGMRRYTIISASQQVASTIRAARFQAVGKNRTLRVRFNCPSASQYRVVEFVNDAGIDAAADRCSAVAYPFPAGDADPNTMPNVDGAVQYLPNGVQFGDNVDDLQIDTSGRITPLVGCPVCAADVAPATIVVSNGDDEHDRTIIVSASGQVHLP